MFHCSSVIKILFLCIIVSNYVVASSKVNDWECDSSICGGKYKRIEEDNFSKSINMLKWMKS